MAFRSLPLFWSTICQVTAHPPMDEVLPRARDRVARMLGHHFDRLPVGRRSARWRQRDRRGRRRPGPGRSCGRRVGSLGVGKSARWYAPPVSLSDAIAQGRQGGKYPVVLADHADNTGGGTPGDSTEVRTFHEQGIRIRWCCTSSIPVAEQAHAAGVGSRIETTGRQVPSRSRPPVEGEFEVVAIPTAASPTTARCSPG